MKIAIIQTVAFFVDVDHYNNQAVGQAKALVDLGCDVDYYAPFKNVKENFVIYKNGENVAVGKPIRGIKILRSIAYFPDILKKISRDKYDVIQTGEDSFLMTPIILRYVKRKFNSKTVMIQGMYKNYNGYKFFLQILFDLFSKRIIQNNVDLIYGKTNDAINYLNSKKYNNVKLFPIGLDYLEPVNNNVLENKIIKFCNNYKKIALYVGSLENRRNPVFLVELLESLRNKGEEIGLIVVGKGDLVFNSEHIFHIDSVPNNQVHLFYKRADIFWIATNYEIYGMAIMESLYWGCPVLSTPEAGPKFILNRKEYGVCLNLSLEKWAEKTIELLNNDCAEWREMRIKYAHTKFGWDNLMDRYLNDLIECR